MNFNEIFPPPPQKRDSSFHSVHPLLPYLSLIYALYAVTRYSQRGFLRSSFRNYSTKIQADILKLRLQSSINGILIVLRLPPQEGVSNNNKINEMFLFKKRRGWCKPLDNGLNGAFVRSLRDKTKPRIDRLMTATNCAHAIQRAL